jgi:hypothetical protein
MNRVQIGTDRYKYPFVPNPKKVQIGTTPFRGVPFVPGPKGAMWATVMPEKSSAGTRDLFGVEMAARSTNDRHESTAFIEVLTARPGKENQHD